MELRVLRYFLTIAREGNITGAANVLHITQPTLSRQIRDLEEELGQQLFVRNSHSVSLTEEGMLLRKRAEEILELVDKTQRELSQGDEFLSGDVYIGAGETVGVHFLTEAACRLQQEYPDVHFHISSGDGTDVCEQLDKGLIDFGLLFDHVDFSKYHAIPLPYRDVWGVLMRRDSPLAWKESIRPEDLLDQPLIISRQALQNGLLAEWFGQNISRLRIVGTYNLVFNGSLMVEDGMGCVLCLDRIINVSGDSGLCFRPLEPRLEAGMHLVWKKYQIFSKAAEKYLELLLELGK
ncbi:LysR family transcriptional regulator [Angelakisella massiliensis]|uniref:LysR family transcriptional regulator n=1 Tax=Angelakisella massiliensis TaxID=1871018 RepID=UPI0008F8B854|nr:LysR family transcriptional regulator [Angelakisella massiliensis]